MHVMPQSLIVLIVLGATATSTMSTIELCGITGFSQHCLASFWRQTNIKISPDLGSLSTKEEEGEARKRKKRKQRKKRATHVALLANAAKGHPRGH